MEKYQYIKADRLLSPTGRTQWRMSLQSPATEFYIVSSRLPSMDPISCVYDTQSKVMTFSPSLLGWPPFPTDSNKPGALVP
jgi:hypothetical protein